MALLVAGNLMLPFERLVTLHGAGGSKAEFFEDAEVRELLLRHHITVQITRQGSRGAATGDLDGLDFVFPSGQPAAELVAQRRRDAQQYSAAHRPFVSPIVLATYREYAETLRAAGVARSQTTPGFERPYYYDLDLRMFLDLARAERSWDDLGIAAQGFTNGNTVLAQTTDVCAANSAATYLGLVSYLTRGGVPTSEHDAIDLANQIKPLLRGQGLPLRGPETIYFVQEGREIAPVIVIYEHQYLAYQLRHRERFGAVDEDRVLLYPNTVFQTEPTFMALNTDADRLGALLSTDPGLRRRALELGFRVLDSERDDSSEQLPQFLAERGVPEPSTAASDTRAVLPTVQVLEAMVAIVGDCSPVVPS